MKTRLRLAAAFILLALIAGCSANQAGSAEPKNLSESAPTAAAAATGSGSPASTSADAAEPGQATSEPAAAATETPQLVGTTWAGTDSDGDYYTYRFEADGQFGYTSPSGTYGGQSDTWSQSGDQVTMKTDGGYSTYIGTIQGDTISGSASNITGRS